MVIKRAYSINLNAGGDTLEDLLDALNSAIDHIERDKSMESVCGGVSYGYNYKVESDPQ